MATVTGYTANRMKIIEDTTVVDGEVRTDNLILVTREGTEIDAGSVRGPQGIKGDTGEVSQAELDAAMAAQSAALTAAMFKPGMLMMFGGPTVPSDWLKCDGAMVSRTQYAALFAVIGINYGNGNGTSTFTLPNLSTRMPFGLGNAPYNVLGYNQGGELAHQLTTAEMAQHSHDLWHNHSASSGANDVGHAHGISVFGLGGASTHSIPGGGGWGYGNTFTNNQNSDHSHPITVNHGGGTTTTIGSNNTHNNMPPFVVVNFMIHI
jgi:microcystin-dependent protein